MIKLGSLVSQVIPAVTSIAPMPTPPYDYTNQFISALSVSNYFYVDYSTSLKAFSSLDPSFLDRAEFAYNNLPTQSVTSAAQVLVDQFEKDKANGVVFSKHDEDILTMFSKMKSAYEMKTQLDHIYTQLPINSQASAAIYQHITTFNDLGNWAASSFVQYVYNPVNASVSPVFQNLMDENGWAMQSLVDTGILNFNGMSTADLNRLFGLENSNIGFDQLLPLIQSQGFDLNNISNLNALLSNLGSLNLGNLNGIDLHGLNLNGLQGLNWNNLDLSHIGNLASAANLASLFGSSLSKITLVQKVIMGVASGASFILSGMLMVLTKNLRRKSTRKVITLVSIMSVALFVIGGGIIAGIFMV